MGYEIVSDRIEEYCEGHTSPENDLLAALARETRRSREDAGMQVGHLEGSFLRILVRLSRAQRILELGTFTGYSSLSMAEGLPEDGKLITCDLDPVATETARKYWAQSPHGKKITLHLGPALETLRELGGPFDLVFIDADKENYVHYWEACLPKLRHGGIVVVDNVLWSGRVLAPEDEKDETDRAIVAFNDHALRDSRVEQVMLPVRDGMLLCRKI